MAKFKCLISINEIKYSKMKWNKVTFFRWSEKKKTNSILSQIERQEKGKYKIK